MAKLVFDENLVTIGDLEDFEDACGMPLEKALKPVPMKDDEGNVVRHDCSEGECEDDPCKEGGRPVLTVTMSPKILKALVWIANRHDRPGFSLEDARNVRVSELEIVREGEQDGADPKD